MASENEQLSCPSVDVHHIFQNMNKSELLQLRDKTRKVNGLSEVNWTPFLCNLLIGIAGSSLSVVAKREVKTINGHKTLKKRGIFTLWSC